MSCTHPFHAFPTGLKTSNGNDDYFLSFTRDTFIPAWQVSKARGVPFSRDLTEYIEIPCGQCYECRKDKARKWSFRCLFESFEHEKNYFLTLTYDDMHIGKNELDKRDLQLFLKRLRKSVGEFRYFACGEYGDKGNRKHYHILCFGLPLNEKKLIRLTGGNMPLFRSEEIEDIWRNGFASVGIARPNAVGQYIAKYTLKNDGPNGFLTMSRRPGLGFNSMLAYVMANNPNPASWKLLTIGDGRGNIVKGGLPRSLREKLGWSACEEVTRACIVKFQNKMRACGFITEDLSNLDMIEFYRMTQEELDKGKEVARNLGKF